MFLYTMKLVLAGIPVIAVLVNAESTSRFISAKLSGKKVFKKEGENLNLTWKYKIDSLHPHGSKVIEFLFGEWIHPGYISKKCLIVDENGEVVKAKNCETKYGYYKNPESNGIYHQSSVAIYNLTKSDMKKRYGIDIEMGIHRSPLEDWFELHSFVKARISHLSISRNRTVKQGDAVNITCRATGGPEPIVTLYKGDQVINEEKGEAKQEIKAAAMQNAGEYQCVASNDDGIPDKRSITLSVDERPEVQVRSGSKKCSSAPWIIGLLLICRWS